MGKHDLDRLAELIGGAKALAVGAERPESLGIGAAMPELPGERYGEASSVPQRLPAGYSRESAHDGR